MPEQVLQEAVLALLGRARIRLQPQHLPAHQRRQQRLEPGRVEAGQRDQRGRGERLAQHRSVADEPPLLGRQPVQAGSDQRVQRLRHLERLDLARDAIRGTILDQEATIEQHPHRLDRIQRHTLRPRQDLAAQRRRQPRHQARQQLAHRLLGERLQVQRGEVAVARAPGRPPLGQLRPRQRDHEQGMVARPLEQVLDEVEQTPASAHCMSSNANTVGYVSARRSKNSRQAANRS